MNQPPEQETAGHRGSPSDAGEWRNLRDKRSAVIARWNKRTKKIIIYTQTGRNEFYLGEHSENGTPRQNSTDVLG